MPGAYFHQHTDAASSASTGINTNSMLNRGRDLVAGTRVSAAVPTPTAQITVERPADGKHWINEQDIEGMFNEFVFADEALVDQIIDLLDPDALDPENRSLGQDDASFPSRLTPLSADVSTVQTTSTTLSTSPARTNSRSGDSRPPCFKSDHNVDECADSAVASSVLLDTVDDDFDAMGRRKGGGRPQPLDGLSDRRKQQILKRRIRNRESMRRMRARYKGTKEQLFQLETALHEKRLAIDAHQHQASSMQTTLTIVPAAEAATTDQATEVLRAAMKQKLLDLQHAELLLSQESISLRQQMGQFESCLLDISDTIQEIQLDPETCPYYRHHPEFLPSTLGGMLSRQSDYSWMERILPLLPQISSTDTNEIYKLVRQSYVEVLAASRAAEKYLATSNKVLGWRDTRCVNGTWLDFVFRKEVFRDDVDTIASKTWALQTSGESVNEVMPQKHQMKILRRLNDSTLICARNLVFPGDATNYCTIYLLMLVHNGADGYVIAQRTLEPQTSDMAALQSLLGPNHSYVNVFYGLMLSPRTGDDGTQVLPGCQVSFGGRVGNGTSQYASTWSMDILVAILRWESMCVAPILQLANTDETKPGSTSIAAKER